MRHWIIGLVLGLAAPAFASEKCDRFQDVVKRVCARSFSIALGRDLSTYSGKRQQEENDYAGSICMAAVELMQNSCKPDFGSDRSIPECEFISNVNHTMIRQACVMAYEQDERIGAQYKILGKNQRIAMCKNAIAQVKPVTLRTCK